MQTADIIRNDSGPNEPARLAWALPVVWCGVTAAIIASGLVVQLGGGTGASFGYVFDVTGHGVAFKQGLALYGLAAAVLGAAFMFVPKLGRGTARWDLHKGLAWTTFMLMVIGGIVMLIVPQILVAIAQGGGDRAEGLATMWSGAWVEAGAKLSFAGVIIGVATFLEAWFRARPAR
ncbi:MAG TPA: hypothetical protein VGO52_26945 [Hyphomonadaceae bacterium]|jgi:hypothetical protein|nr:hypothetical protein [Hyphomonadaceae bacterium]